MSPCSPLSESAPLRAFGFPPSSKNSADQRRTDQTAKDEEAQ